MKILRPGRCIAWDGKPCAACTEYIKLERETHELELEIKKINISRRALRTVLNENHDQLIHKFPPEIASHIFAQYAPLSACFDKYGRNNPLYLGAVCQKWRQLAWATSGFWTSLRIQLCKDGPVESENDKRLPQLVTEWLERSASVPLTIRLDDHCRRVGVGDTYWDGVINILNKHSAGWQDMEFDFPAHHLHPLCGSSQETILRRLGLRHPPTFSRSHPSEYSTFRMKSYASPTDLTLLAIGLPYVDIIWNNLTASFVQNIGLDECIELIR